MSPKIRDLAPAVYAEAAIRWWLRELWGLLPSAWQTKLGRNEPIVLEASRAAAGVDVAKYSAERSPSAAAGKAAEGVLLIDSGLAYVRSVDLPLVSSSDTAHIVGFEARRHSPLPFERIYYDYRIVGRSLRSRRQTVEIMFLRREAIDSAREFAVSVGLRLSGVCIDVPNGPVRLAHLLHGSWYSGWLSSSQRRLARQCAVAAAYICMGLIVVWIRLQTLSVAAQSELNAARLAANSGVHVELELHRLIEQVKLLNEARQRSRALDVIEEATRLLPNSAWLVHLDLKGDRVEMRGIAQNASALINLYSGSKLFGHVSFAGPLTREPLKNLEDFQLRLSLQ